MTHANCSGLCARGILWAAAAASLMVGACDQKAERPATASASAEWREFEGSWNAAGTRRTIPLGTTSQALALLAVFLDVSIRGGVPAPLMAPGLLFASSYFSVITPQGGSQNIIFVASGYRKQSELYKLGLLTTLAFMAVYLVIGTPWMRLVMR